MVPGNPAEIPWPDGDRTGDNPLPAGVDATALQAASDWAFNRESPEQVTLSLLIVKGGQIIHERYAPGVDVTTRTRTWSSRGKRFSIASVCGTRLWAWIASGISS